MSLQSEIITEGLWNPQVATESYGSNELYQTHLFEQYKLYVNSADEISARRNIANSLFVTLHTLVLGIIAFAYDKGPQLSYQWILVFPLLAIISLCFLWWRLIQSYRQLNAVKYQVIREYEMKLPTRPYWEAEWKALGEGKDSHLYLPLTNIENFLPWFFMLLYIFGAIIIWFFA